MDFVERERGVFGGGADEDELSGLDGGEENVLLLLVEAVDLVHEEDGRKMAEPVFVFRLICDRLDVLNAGSAARERTEGAASVMGNDLRNGGLAATRRTEENGRWRRIVLQKGANDRILTKQVGISLKVREIDFENIEILKLGRPNALSKRLSFVVNFPSNLWTLLCTGRLLGLGLNLS